QSEPGQREDAPHHDAGGGEVDEQLPLGMGHADGEGGKEGKDGAGGQARPPADCSVAHRYPPLAFGRAARAPLAPLAHAWQSLQGARPSVVASTADIVRARSLPLTTVQSGRWNVWPPASTVTMPLLVPSSTGATP